MTFSLLAAVALALLSGQAAQQPPVSDTACPQMAAALQTLLRNDTRMRDWAQLDRFRDANRELAPPSRGEPRTVFMGDSITDFWRNPRFGDFFSRSHYIDRGISGQTTPQMLVRFRPDVIDLAPSVVVILAGTNDVAGNTGAASNEDIQRNIESMVDLAHAHGIKVVLASITPTSAYHTRAGDVPQTTRRPMGRIRTLNEWMKTYAASHGDVYLDYFSAMIDKDGVMQAGLTEDDLHPNAAGYAIMGPLANAAIERALHPAR